MPRTMLFPSRLTASAEAVRAAADARGLTTAQPAAVHLPEDPVAHHLHAGPTFADAVPAAAALIGEVFETLPSAIVVDVGLLDDRLVVIEANAAWASGIYLSDADAALDVILRAAAPAGDLSPRDKASVRPVAARAILTEGGVR